MNIAGEVSDNVSEVLLKIISFTQVRETILTENINNVHADEFTPRDLAVDEFSALMNEAINEHVCNHRLLLRDTDNIKFGAGGNFQVKALIDNSAKRLLEESPDQYLEEQLNRLTENRLNQKIAAELLRKKEKAVSIFG